MDKVVMRGFSSAAASHAVDVIIAVGTNMGNRGLNLHRGVRRLRELGVQVLRHSALYETAAAYVTDQPSFLNAALLARTNLPPGELLRVLKQVEAEAGRDLEGGLRFGPRPLDMDIVFYGAGPYRDDRLQVPHPRWRERPFVQAPVSDLLYRRDGSDTGTSTSGTRPPAGGSGSSHSSSSSCTNNLRNAWRGSSSSSGGPAGVPGSSSTGDNSSGGGPSPQQPLPTGHPGSVMAHLRTVRDVWWETLRLRGSGGSSSNGSVDSGSATGSSAADGGDVMRRVTPLVNLPAAPSGAPVTSSSAATGHSDDVLSWGCRTHLMAILNVTPDSFSDGGKHSGGVAAAVAAAEAMVAEGADWIDVGGQSTRPGAVRLSPGEELARVMPVLRALRQSPRLRQVPLSVDTFYSEVAREAVAGGGANLVNDVSGGAADPHMWTTVAELGVPYILMHMRGDPGTMSRPEHTTYDTGSVWREVGAELQWRAEAAEAAGVAAWNIILDPGIGFAKTADGNVELLRNLGALRREALDGPYGEGLPGSGLAGPMLVGPSRKRFLGSLTGREVAAERDAATAAACVVCVAGGADVVRVHAVREVRDALRVADAVYSGGAPYRIESLE